VRDLQERRAVVPALADGGRRLLIPVVAGLVIVADQLSKTWAIHHLQTSSRHILGSVNFVLAYNAGAAFSLGTGVTPFIEAGVVVLVVVLLLFSRRASRHASVPVAIGLGLLLGGALGNLFDRVFRHLPGHPGAVVDFIQAATWWPVFNVADSSIVVGVALLLLTYRTRG
jgi:signal peptidase II